MASGCFLVASDVEPVREVALAAAEWWTTDASQLLKGLETGLSLAETDREVRGCLQRSHVMQAWSREASLSSWLDLLEI